MNYLECISKNDCRAKLRRLEKQLKELTSEEQRREMALAEIEAELG